jgi:GPH family glycoside/pentoside/hexuronide:cation symporter
LLQNTKVLGVRGALVYSTGEVGGNLVWNMVSGFILLYYTNVALLPVAAVGLMLFLTRVLDAVIDPLIGIAVDRTRTRWGRARPYLLAGSVPFVIVTVLTFSVPQWSVGAKLIYAYVTFTLAGILYSVIYIPYNALLPLMTSNPEDKLRVSSYRAMAASAGSIIMYSSMMALVAWLGHGNQQIGFTATSCIMGIAAALSMMLVFAYCRERPEAERAGPRETMRAGISGMLRNPVWLIVAAFAFFLFIRLGSLVSVTPFFATDVLGRPSAMAFLFSSLSVSILIGGYIAKPVISRIGKRAANLMALGTAVGLAAVMATAMDRPWLFDCCYFIANISIGIQSTTCFLMVADSVDYQERAQGHRSEGMLTSAVSFTMKVGMAVGGAIIAAGLALAHYHPGAVTVEARDGIRLLYLGIPSVFAIVQAIIISFYSRNLVSNRALNLGLSA